MRKGRRTGLARAALLALLVVCGTAPAPARTLRAADNQVEDYPTVQALFFLDRTIQERTGGRHRLQIFHSRQLGEEKETIEQMRAGAIDLARVNAASLAGFVPEFDVLVLPFLFRSTDHANRVLDGPIGEEILGKLDAHGFVGLAFYDSGARSFYNSKRAINTPADMKGLKIRVQQSDLFVGLVNALGANATPMAFGEVYSALQTGVIDGAENNWPSFESTRHFEVAKFYSQTEHSLSPEVLVMSKRSWDKLSKEDQALVRAAAKESVAKMRELWDAAEKSAESKVKAGGAQVNNVEKQPFIDAMKPVYDRFVTDAKLKDMVSRIQAQK